jgi:hypothetical protein
MDSGFSSVVEHLPHHRMIKGLSPITSDGTKSEKMTESSIKFLIQNSALNRAPLERLGEQYFKANAIKF